MFRGGFVEAVVLVAGTIHCWGGGCDIKLLAELETKSLAVIDFLPVK